MVSSRSNKPYDQRMSKAYTPQVGTARESLGITICAKDIPPGSKKIWKLLNQAYGATAIFTWGNTSITYFRTGNEGLSFSEMVDGKMDAPKITDRVYQSSAGFADTIEFLLHEKQRDKETKKES